MTKFFSKNNNLIPSIGLGTWDLRGNAGEKVIEEAIDVGYRGNDLRLAESSKPSLKSKALTTSN